MHEVPIPIDVKKLARAATSLGHQFNKHKFSPGSPQYNRAWQAMKNFVRAQILNVIMPTEQRSELLYEIIQTLPIDRLQEVWELRRKLMIELLAEKCESAESLETIGSDTLLRVSKPVQNGVKKVLQNGRTKFGAVSAMV